MATKRKKAPASPAQAAAAAIARQAQAIPEGTIAVQSTVWIPEHMAELWKRQKPSDRGDGWVKGMTGEFPWDELEELRSMKEQFRKLMEARL